MAMQASNCRYTRETHRFTLLAQDIPGRPYKGNIRDTREIIGGQPVAQHDPGQGAEKAEAGCQDWLTMIVRVNSQVFDFSITSRKNVVN